MTVTERDRIVSLEAVLAAHVESSNSSFAAIKASLSEMDNKLDTLASWQDRRIGVEALGKYIFPGLAVVVSLSALALSLVN